MGAEESDIGKAHIANVSVSEARAFNPADDDPNEPESWETVSASDFNEEKHGQCQFYCPCCLDNGDKVRLKKPSGGYFQNILFDVIDPETQDVMTDPATGTPVTENRRYYIPPRYSLYPGQRHTCDLASRLRDLSATIRENGGLTLNSAAGAYILNINIPGGQELIRKRPRIYMTSAEDFDTAAGADPNIMTSRRIHRSQTNPPSKRSTGVLHVESLAKILDSTEFDKGQRKHVILRIGQDGITLDQAYHGKAVNLYRDLYEKESRVTREDAPNHNQVALFHFKPIGNRKFWTKDETGSMTVQSQAEQIHDNEGRHFYVSARLHFSNRETFRAFEQAYRKDGERSFLVFSEQATVDLEDFKNKKGRIDSRLDDHATVFVDIPVGDSAQIMPWAPRSPQMTFDFPGFNFGNNPTANDADTSPEQSYEPLS
ncbi:MAG: hypothetical protein KDI90_04910 [Alphaproteobacteria bacterium]|nr:hypothetical protein [Alphaproteobacteria bacterium]MCB9975115.1 hypothetical protein [Rhodospirillales bacterium]